MDKSMRYFKTEEGQDPRYSYQEIDIYKEAEKLGLVKGGWVSVKDKHFESRYPETIVNSKSKGIIAGFKHNGCWYSVYNDEDGPIKLRDVTHYYQLPPPPSEDAEVKEEKKPEYKKEAIELGVVNAEENYLQCKLSPEAMDDLVERLKAEGLLKGGEDE